jgi:hypothetical protein
VPARGEYHPRVRSQTRQIAVGTSHSSKEARCPAAVVGSFSGSFSCCVRENKLVLLPFMVPRRDIAAFEGVTLLIRRDGGDGPSMDMAQLAFFASRRALRVFLSWQ